MKSRLQNINHLSLPTVLPTLRSARLVLRAMEDADAVALFDIYGDPRVMRYTDEPPFPDQGTVALMLKSVRKLLASGGSLEWAIVSDDDSVTNRRRRGCWESI